MRQRAPSATDADVERVVRRDFADEHVAHVLATLGEYGHASWHLEPPVSASRCSSWPPAT